MDRSAPRIPDPRYERDSPAVEVIAMFDGAIVEARHFDDPAGGVVRRSTTLQLGGGAAALVLALGLFTVAYLRGGGLLLDLSCALLVAVGLTALVRGLLHRHEDQRPRDFTVGCSAQALLPLAPEVLAEPALPLLRSTGTSFELVITDRMRGLVSAGDRTVPLVEAARAGHDSDAAPGARALPFLEGMRARVDIGRTTVHLKSVPAPRRQPVPLTVDVTSLRYTGMVFAAAAGFLALLFALPPDASALSLDGYDRAHRFARVVITPPQLEEPKPPPWLKKPDEKKTARGGRLHKGDAGIAGSKKAPDAHKRLSIKGPPDNKELTLARRQEAVEMAKSSGVLGMMRSRDPMLSSLFSKSESALGTEAEHVMGNLIGNQVGPSGGVEGLGLVGSGRDGGGAGLNTLGFGPLDGIGSHGCGGKGCGDGEYGATRKVASLRTHTIKPVVTYDHAPTIVGGLDKEIIRRVIRRHANEVRFCYEQALVKQPDLYGKVVVKFAIAPQGSVSTAVPADATVGYEVGRCVSEAVRRMEFPKPLGGGVVMVSYPFVFRAAAAAE